MESNAFRNPDDVMKKLISGEVEVLRYRDPVLGAALDQSPPPVHGVGEDQRLARGGAAPDRGLAYRVLRKLYRRLKQVEFLRSPLDRLRRALQELRS